jgi:xanthine dehydrogenase accessory factor
MPHIYLRISELVRKKQRFALAVVLEAKGSAPQGAGASALFTSKKLIAGTVGGGAIEADVRKKAASALRKAAPLVAGYSLKGKAVGESGICGGEVRVLIDPYPEKHKNVFNRLARSLDAGRPGVLATMVTLGSGGRIALKRDWIAAKARSPLENEIVDSFSDGVPRLAKLRVGRDSGAAEEELLFIEPVFPPSRLVIVGAGHIGRAVSHFGRLLDFEVSVIDDRRRFANRKNLPDAGRLIRADFGKGLATVPFTQDTYIVIATPGHEQDAEALRACVRSNAGYIGLVGSRTKIALMREEFLAKRWATPPQFDRVHAPIGLPIGSKTVQEIAVSIAAELVLERRRNMEKKGGRK